MATYGWRSDRSVAEGLYSEGHRFAFLQAVRLLEEMLPLQTPPGEGVDPRREVVLFKSHVRMDFPPGDIEEVRAPLNGQPAQMTVNVLGLAGALGPLPASVTELIMERSFRRDTAFRDFLDIFNHRLVSLLYRARKKYRPALDRKAPDRGRVARVLYSLIGLGTPHLAARLGIPDRSLLPYAGFLVDASRSNVGLERLLEHCFAMTVAIAPFQGRWLQIEPEDVTRIGLSGQNQRLGSTAVLGGRMWDQAASFEVRLGPLTLERFRAFLPTGDAYRPLVAAIRYYTREELSFTLRLELEAAEVPELRLGRGAQLGWTSWLKTREVKKNDAQVRLVGRA
ncbi:MAG TPA: type VI secretion system baseplate subunit TssG [Thermoanaerobaculia bacterium]